MNKLKENKEKIYNLIKDNNNKLDAVDLVEMSKIGAWFVSIAIDDLKKENRIIGDNMCSKYRAIESKNL